jgi:hypothetical protein
LDCWERCFMDFLGLFINACSTWWMSSSALTDFLLTTPFLLTVIFLVISDLLINLLVFSCTQISLNSYYRIVITLVMCIK